MPIVEGVVAVVGVGCSIIDWDVAVCVADVACVQAIVGDHLAFMAIAMISDSAVALLLDEGGLAVDGSVVRREATIAAPSGAVSFATGLLNAELANCSVAPRTVTPSTTSVTRAVASSASPSPRIFCAGHVSPCLSVLWPQRFLRRVN
jgi:hypothetical protein